MRRVLGRVPGPRRDPLPDRDLGLDVRRRVGQLPREPRSPMSAASARSRDGSGRSAAGSPTEAGRRTRVSALRPFRRSLSQAGRGSSRPGGWWPPQGQCEGAGARQRKCWFRKHRGFPPDHAVPRLCRSRDSWLSRGKTARCERVSKLVPISTTVARAERTLGSAECRVLSCWPRSSPSCCSRRPAVVSAGTTRLWRSTFFRPASRATFAFRRRPRTSSGSTTV